ASVIMAADRFAVTPTLDEVRALAGQGRLVPIYREILADVETPVSAYLKVARGAPSFLLESVEGGERLARYSFVGTEPRARLLLHKGQATIENEGGRRTGPCVDPLALIDEWVGQREPVPLAGLPRFRGGAVGYLAYELARAYERLPAPTADPLGLPLGALALYDTLLVFDHLQRTIKLVTHVPLHGDVAAAYEAGVARIDALALQLAAPPTGGALALDPQGGAGAALASSFTRPAFERAVEAAKEHIRAGDAIQIVLAQRFWRETHASPFMIYRALRA